MNEPFLVVGCSPNGFGIFIQLLMSRACTKMCGNKNIIIPTFEKIERTRNQSCQSGVANEHLVFFIKNWMVGWI